MPPASDASNKPSVNALTDYQAGGYLVNVNIYVGVPAQSWKLYENGVLIHEANFSQTAGTPQSDELHITDNFTATGARLDYFSTNEFGDSELTVSGNTITWGSHIEEARDAGVRQILFGAGVGASTDSIGSEPTDDYWWITKVQEYYQYPVSLDGGLVSEEPTVRVSGATVTEGGSGFVMAALTVSLSKPATEAVTVNYQTSNGTATAGEDYEAASGQISFAIGETSKTISIRILGDTQVEPDQQFYVTLSSAVLDGNLSMAAGTIVNDDVVTQMDVMVTTPFETAVILSTGTSAGGDPDFGSHVQPYVTGTLFPSQYSQEQPGALSNPLSDFLLNGIPL